jgi:ubiquitin-protein ligase
MGAPLKRLEKEYETFQTSTEMGFTAWPTEDDRMHWKATITGPVRNNILLF